MILSKAKIFFLCLISFTTGIGLASFVDEKFIRHEYWLFSLVLIFLALAIFFWQAPEKGIYKMSYGPVFLLLFSFLFGFWRYSVSIIQNQSGMIWNYNGQTVTVFGYIDKEPDLRQSGVKYEMEADSIVLAESEKPKPIKIGGKLLFSTEVFPEYHFSERLSVRCQLKAPEEFNGFKYDRYLARYDVYSLCYFPQIKLLNQVANRSFLAITNESIFKTIYALKNKLRTLIDMGVAEPEAGLLKATLLGDMRGIPVDLQQAFSRSGTSHIIAISGMHITILAAIVMNLLLFFGLKRKQAFYFATVILVLYLIMIGLPASAVRSGVMGFLVLWALYLGRLSKLGHSLMIAATLMFIVNPRILRDDVGSQLSFLAVLGICYAYPKIKEWFDKGKIPEFFGIRDMFTITMAAQVFTLPIVVYNFGIFSLVAPLSNILVLWTSAILLTSLLVGLVLGFLLPQFVTLWLMLPRLLFVYIEKVAIYSVMIPFSYLELPYVSAWWLVVYYVIVSIVFLRPEKVVSLKLEIRN